MIIDDKIFDSFIKSFYPQTIEYFEMNDEDMLNKEIGRLADEINLISVEVRRKVTLYNSLKLSLKTLEDNRYRRKGKPVELDDDGCPF